MVSVYLFDLRFNLTIIAMCRWRTRRHNIWFNGVTLLKSKNFGAVDAKKIKETCDISLATQNSMTSSFLF